MMISLECEECQAKRVKTFNRGQSWLAVGSRGEGGHIMQIDLRLVTLFCDWLLSLWTWKSFEAVH